MIHKPQDAEEEMLRLQLRLQLLEAQERATTNFIDFCQYVWPEMLVGEHHRRIAAALDRVIEGKCKRLIVAMPPRHGKLVAHSTPVLTPDGWTTHGELVPGSVVYHPSGQPVEVLAVSQEDQAQYEVHTSLGEKVLVHGNHEWTVSDRSRGQWRTVETKYLQTQKLHSGPVGRGGRYRFQLPQVEPLQMEPQLLRLDPYFLGVWLGDGRSSAADFVYHPKDPEPRQELERRGFVISSEHVHATTGVISVAFGGQGIRTALRQMGLLNNKHIPREYLMGSVEQRLDLLAGLIDTDGHVERSTGRVRIATACARLKDDIVELLTGLGQRPYVFEQQPVVSTSGIEGRQVVYYVGFQPTVDIPTVIPRKQMLRLAPRRMAAITKVVKVEQGQAGRCIEVDSPDGLYLVGRSLIPTHNSQLGSYLFPAYLMGRRPDAKLIVGSHTAELAQRFGRMIRNLVEHESRR